MKYDGEISMTQDFLFGIFVGLTIAFSIFYCYNLVGDWECVEFNKDECVNWINEHAE